jgi:hypothetical protein
LPSNHLRENASAVPSLPIRNPVVAADGAAVLVAVAFTPLIQRLQVPAARRMTAKNDVPAGTVVSNAIDPPEEIASDGMRLAGIVSQQRAGEPNAYPLSCPLTHPR